MSKNSYLIGLMVILTSGIYTLLGVNIDTFSQGTWVTVLEWISPGFSNFIANTVVYSFIKAFFYLSSVLWVGLMIFNINKKYLWVIALLNCISFLFISSAYWESRSWFGHSLVLTFWFLLFLTMDSFSEHKKHNSWPFQYGFVIYGFFYFLAGIKKLYEGGLEWMFGDSLALWHHLMGKVELSSTELFPVLSTLTILIEVGVVFLLLSGKKSLVLTAALLVIALHLGIFFILDFNFIGHIMISLLLIYLTFKENFHTKIFVKKIFCIRS